MALVQGIKLAKSYDRSTAGVRMVMICMYGGVVSDDCGSRVTAALEEKAGIIGTLVLAAAGVPVQITCSCPHG